MPHKYTAMTITTMALASKLADTDDGVEEMKSLTLEESNTTSSAAAGPSKTNPDKSPGRDVAHITELLEQILLYLDCFDLYTGQSVSRSFSSTIAGSTALQTRMFLKPNTISPRYWRYIPTHFLPSNRIRPGLQVNIFVNIPSAQTLPSAFLPPYTPIRLNPLLMLRTKKSNSQASVRLERYHEIVNFAIPRLDFTSNPSWPQAFLSDPPCKHAILSVHIRYGLNVQKTMGATVDREEGLRFVDLFRAKGNDIVKQMRALEDRIGDHVTVAGCEIVLKGVVVASAEDRGSVFHLSDDELGQIEKDLYEEGKRHGGLEFAKKMSDSDRYRKHVARSAW